MLTRTPIRFCKSCGASVRYRLPDDGDQHERAVCEACHTVHYENPINVVGTVPYLRNAAGLYKVLLCKRNIAPRKGKWTLPAGFMELGETLRRGALRETTEEAGAHVQMGDLFTLISVPQVNQVHVFFLAQLQSESFQPGVESQAVVLFDECEIPWDELAFRTVERTLEHFFADVRAGAFRQHWFDLVHQHD